MNSVLQIEQLNIVIHDKEQPSHIVNNISFQIEEGEILGLVGESGSGKSMTSLAIAGLMNRKDAVLEGAILYQGIDLLHLERKKLRQLQGNEISMIFQEPMTSLNPVKKIGWQVEESLRIHQPHLSKKERYERAIKALGDVELPDSLKVYHQYPHELSGGMRQRVMIASAIICEPKLLIADEPTTALDVTIQLQIVRLLQKLNREKKMAILFISHDLSLVRKLCNKVLVMYQGHIVEEGKTDHVFINPQNEYTKKLISAIPCISHK